MKYLLVLEDRSPASDKQATLLFNTLASRVNGDPPPLLRLVSIARSVDKATLEEEHPSAGDTRYYVGPSTVVSTKLALEVVLPDPPPTPFPACDCP